MHLRAIKLRGFKSFVDPVEIQLEPGVSVVVGPNGSGKSNVSDSILWATGSMSPGELRAEKPDDVLFAGSTTGRTPVDFAEVDLLFDNSDGAWPDLPFSEVSVARRLHRGGEGQYLVNKAAVRRIDLVELLSDVGLGGGLRSVISQGRVETVLNSKPAERRELIEEAAGLGRFKRRRHRAELKLARVAVQVERARDLEDEVKKRLRPLALQATAAERAEKLGVEIARLQAAIATLDLARLAERRAEAERRRAATAEERRALDEKIAALVAEREHAEEELTDSAGAREQATAALYRLRSGGERIAASPRVGRVVRGALCVPISPRRARTTRAHRSSSSRPRATAAAAAQSAAGERARLQVEAEERWARVAAVERQTQAAAAAQLDDVLARRAETESLLTGGGRDALLALRGATQRLGVRHESSQRLLAELRSELGDAQRDAARPVAGRARPRRRRDRRRCAHRGARARGSGCARARSRANGSRRSSSRSPSAKDCRRPPARSPSRASSSRCSCSRSTAGRERSVAAALGHRASAVLVDDAQRGLELVLQAQSAGLGSVLVLVGRDPRELADLPVVPRDELLASTVPAVTEDGIGWDPASRRALVRGRDRRGGAARARRPAPRAARRGRAARRAAPRRPRSASRTTAERARVAAAAFAPVAHLRNVRRADPMRLERLVGAAERLDETLRVAAAVAVRLETPLAERAGRLAEDLRGIAGREADLRRAVADADARALAAERHANGRTAEPRRRRRCASPRSRPSSSASAAAAATAAEEAADRARAAARALADADPAPRAPAERARARAARRRRGAARGGARRRRRALRGAGARPRRGAGRAHDRARHRAAAARRGRGRAAADARRPRASGSPPSTSSWRAPMPSATRRSGGSTRPRPSRPRARIATSSPRSSTATSGAASSSAR